MYARCATCASTLRALRVSYRADLRRWILHGAMAERRDQLVAGAAFLALSFDAEMGRFVMDRRAALETAASFVTVNGIIESNEIHGFVGLMERLQLSREEHAIAILQGLRRAHALQEFSRGHLPNIAPSIALPSDELVYFESGARWVKRGARSPILAPGLLVVSNKALHFLGAQAGKHLRWAKIHDSGFDAGRVWVATTYAEGAIHFIVPDPELVGAVLRGVLLVNRRLTLPSVDARDVRRVPHHVRAEVWRRDGGACVQCGAASYLEYDHVIPLARGGATSARNLQLLCRRCNASKGAQI